MVFALLEASDGILGTVVDWHCYLVCKESLACDVLSCVAGRLASISSQRFWRPQS